MELEQDYIAIMPRQLLLKTPEFCALHAKEDKNYLKNYSSEKRISTTLAMRNYCRYSLFKLTGIGIKSWKIKVNPDGRRYAVAPNKTEYTISFTHSRRWIGIAISNGPIGIDIEELKAGRDWKEMLPFVKGLESTSKIKTENDFLAHWTEYEARFKYASAAPNRAPSFIHHRDINDTSTLCVASNRPSYHLEYEYEVE